jgi:hypothetical protein
MLDFEKRIAFIITIFVNAICFEMLQVILQNPMMYFRVELAILAICIFITGNLAGILIGVFNKSFEEAITIIDELRMRLTRFNNAGIFLVILIGIWLVVKIIFKYIDS